MLVAYRDEMVRAVADLNTAIGDLPAWRAGQTGAGAMPRTVRPPAAVP
jgi:hypothetical protein